MSFETQYFPLQLLVIYVHFEQHIPYLAAKFVQQLKGSDELDNGNVSREMGSLALVHGTDYF